MKTMHEQTLENGLNVVNIRFPERYTSHLVLCVDVGSKDESDEKRGGAHLLEHMIFRSDEYFSSKDRKRLAEFNGTSMNASTSPTEMILQFSFSPEQLSTVLNLANTSIRARKYVEEEFNTEREGAITNELIMYERDPISRFFSRHLMPRLFRGTPFGEDTLGTIESVNGLKLEDLMTLKDTFFVPNGMVLATGGPLKTEEVMTQALDVFGDLVPKNYPSPSWAHSIHNGNVWVPMEDFKDPKDPKKDLAAVAMGFQFPGRSDIDSPLFAYFQELIGSGMTSMLFEELREKRGIGYSPMAVYQTYRGASTFALCSLETHPSRIEETIEVMNQILHSVKTGMFCEELFEGKKRQHIANCRQRYDNVGYYLTRAIIKCYESISHTPEEHISRINALTMKEVQDCAQKHFNDPVIMVGCAPDYAHLF